MAKRGQNEGSIFKRSNGTWRAQISLEGKRLGYTAETRAECNDWLRRTLDLVDGGMSFSKSEYTLGEFLMEWMQAKKNSLRPKPALQYETIIKNDLLPAFGQAKINQLNLNRFNRYYARLVVEGRGARTIRMIHSVLHSALEHATRTGLISKNPCRGAILPRNPYKEMKIFNEEQVFIFLIAAKSSRFKLIYQLALATGMRQSEILGLKWEDVDWIKSTITVQRQAQFVGGKGIVLLEPKTRSSIRQIALGKSILEELRSLRNMQGELKADRGKLWQENNLIFTTGNGTPFSQRNLTRDYSKMLRNTELPKIRFHDLRHTAASLMINRGIPIVVVSKILGHSKPSVTLNIYAHCISELQYEAAKIMEEITTPSAIDMHEFPLKIEKNQ
jgi:integrase